MSMAMTVGDADLMMVEGENPVDLHQEIDQHEKEKRLNNLQDFMKQIVPAQKDSA